MRNPEKPSKPLLTFILTYLILCASLLLSCTPNAAKTAASDETLFSHSHNAECPDFRLYILMQCLRLKTNRYNHKAVRQ